MTLQVYISYAKADAATAHALAIALEALGFSAWFDELGIAAGESLNNRIKDALHQSSIVVAVLSENSAASPWLQFELGVAFSMDKPVVPVLIGDATLRDLPDWLASLKYIDARGQSLQYAMQGLSEEVIRNRAG